MKSTFVGAAVLAAAIGAAEAQTKTELNFGIISTESSAGLAKQFEPFLKDMEKALGIPVRAFYAQDYGGVIEGMRFGKVDLAWFGNKSAMEAVDRAGGEVFAQTTKPDGTLGYYSQIIAHADRTDISSLKDVLDCGKGLTLGYGDPNSTSGFLVPSYYVFAVNKVDPNKCFKRVVTSNHEGNALAVANKQVDIATNNTESMFRLSQVRPADFAKIKEVWRSPLIPSDPLVWRKDLSPELKAKIYMFVLGYGRLGSPEKVAAERKVLLGTSDGWGPFLASSDAQLYPIRQLELFKDRARLEANDKVAADEKAKKIAEIDAKLAALDQLMKDVPQK